MVGKMLPGQLQAKLFVAGLAIAAVFIGGIMWYFSYYTKTPDYALKMIRESVEKHDVAKFQKYVDADNLLSGMCEDLMAGLIESEKPMPEEAKVALSGFTKMFKTPLTNSFKGAVNQYIETGTWGKDDSKAEDQGIPIDSDLILMKSGIKETRFENIEYTTVDQAAKTAMVGVKVFQKEADESFVLEVQMKQADNGVWRVESVRNFRDFVVFVDEARQQKVQEYIEVTQQLMAKHDENVQAIEKKLMSMLMTSSLGDQAERASLKNIMLNELLPEWMERREALRQINAPESAKTLHRLRLRICDLRINYCQKYAMWMDDKKAKTLKEGNESLKEAKTLEHEAAVIVNRIRDGR